MIFPLNWIRNKSAYVPEYFREHLRDIYHAEWAHIVGHLVVFSGLVILSLLIFRLPQNRRTAIILTVILLAVALVQEALQLQWKGRAFGWPEMFDLGVDLVGGMIGWWLYGRLWGRRQVANKQSGQPTI
jgi:hypothetical protein